MRFALFLAALVVAALPCLSDAQWGGGSSALVSVPSFVHQVARYEWRQHPERPYEWSLFLGGRQVGGYCHRRKQYMALDAGRWTVAVCPVTAPASRGACQCTASGDPCTCGDACPCCGGGSAEQAAECQRNHDAKTGVDWSKIGPVEEVRIGDRRLSMEDLGREIGQQFEDDSKRPHLSIVAKDAATRKRIDADLKGPLASLAAAYRVQVYDPAAKSNRALLEPFRLEDDARYQVSGVAIYFQAPADEHGQARPDVVLYDAEKLAEALRKKHPDFDPNKLPVLPLPKVSPFTGIDDTVRSVGIGAVCVLGALLILTTMQPKKKG